MQTQRGIAVPLILFLVFTVIVGGGYFVQSRVSKENQGIESIPDNESGFGRLLKNLVNSRGGESSSMPGPSSSPSSSSPAPTQQPPSGPTHTPPPSTTSPTTKASPTQTPTKTASPQPTSTPTSRSCVPPSGGRNSYVVKPYLVYPSDKPMYSQYEASVRNYLSELQQWYCDKVGATFAIAPLQIVRSSYNYQTMRCGENPSQDCLNDPKRMDGNWGYFMNKAIHNGVEKWDEQTAALIFSAGGGGYAGANVYSNHAAFAISGDWVLEPISGVANGWGIPCKYSDGWQCSGGVPKGTPAHELGHAFGLPHPGQQYKDQTIMEWHGNYPSKGFINQESEFLLQSPFFK